MKFQVIFNILQYKPGPINFITDRSEKIYNVFDKDVCQFNRIYYTNLSHDSFLSCPRTEEKASKQTTVGSMFGERSLHFSDLIRPCDLTLVVTRQVSPVEQELFTLPEHLSAPPVFQVGLCCSICSSVLLCTLFFILPLNYLSIYDLRLLIIRYA